MKLLGLSLGQNDFKSQAYVQPALCKLLPTRPKGSVAWRTKRLPGLLEKMV